MGTLNLEVLQKRMGFFYSLRLVIPVSFILYEMVIILHIIKKQSPNFHIIFSFL